MSRADHIKLVILRDQLLYGSEEIARYTIGRKTWPKQITHYGKDYKPSIGIEPRIYSSKLMSQTYYEVTDDD